MVAKLKLRIVNGIPEVDGEPNEIAEVLRQLSITSQPIQPQPIQPNPQREECETSDIQDIEELDPEELVKMVESSGEPITISMGDLQKRLYRRRISSKDEKQLYEIFRRAFYKAKDRLEKKHPDHHWGESKMITIENMPTKRFTLVRNPPLLVKQQMEAQGEQPENQPETKESNLLKY